MSERTIKVKADVHLPMVPSFLRYDGGSIPVGDIPEKDLRRIGEAWTEALVERAREQREGESE